MKYTLSLSALLWAAPVSAQTVSESGRFEVVPLGFVSVTDRFVNHAGAGLALGYHFNDWIGVEAIASIPGLVAGRYTDLVTDLYDYESLTPQSVDMKQIDFLTGLAAQLTPLWGEALIFDQSLSYHVYVVGGIGLVRTLETCIPGMGDCSEDVGIGRGLQRPTAGSEANRLAGHVGLGLRLGMSDLLGLRFEVRDVLFSDRDEEFGFVSEELKHNILMVAGVSLLL